MSSSNTFIHLHTLDLRVHDSPSLHVSHSPSSAISSKVTNFLPVYIFDSRQTDTSQLPHSPSVFINPADDDPQRPKSKSRNTPKSRTCGFHRTSPQKLAYLIQSVYELRDVYRHSGGDLLIGYGIPEKLLPALVKHLKENDSKVEGVWAQKEITVEEEDVLRRLRSNLKDSSTKLHLNDSKTLMREEKLPFSVDQTPDIYTSFRKRVEGLGLNLDGDMLEKPMKTAVWEVEGHGVKNVKVSVGKEGTRLKPFPNIDLSKISSPESDVQGGWIQKGSEFDTVQGLYTALAKPLTDNPPIAGWCKASKNDPNQIPKPASAIPFSGGETSALSRLEDYVGHTSPNGWVNGQKAKTYKATRNGMIGEGFSTKFASLLALGTLSAKEVGWRVGSLLEKVGKDKQTYNNVYWIIFEVLWRDFFQFTVQKYSLVKKSSLFDLTGFSEQIKTYPADERPKPNEWHYANFNDPEDPAVKWCEGRTGVPYIDANMRELVETGYMSNRGRQNVASFLVKDLYVDWRVGAEFFEMHLVDYDTCSNWGNWQYQAGVGNDPRSSRQFNPIKQASDYDPDSEYVKLWVPELKNLPNEFIQTPWLLNNPSKLGDYPHKPIVESPHWRKFYPTEGGGRRGHGSGGRGRGRGRGRGK